MDKGLFGGPGAKVPRYGSGEVADFFEMEAWELHRFLDRYQLTSSGQLGKGRGSRRWFTTEDVYKIATARFLIDDGFSREMVSQIVQTLEDRDFYGTADKAGDFSAMGVFVQRANDNRVVGVFSSAAPPQIRVGGPIYYALTLDLVTRDVDQKMKRFSPKEKT